MEESRSAGEIQFSTTLDSPLSSLLRSLYLHGVEHCVLALGALYPIYPKDQIISLLERGHPDKKIRDAADLLSSTSILGLLDQKMLEPMTPVLLVTERGADLIPAERLPAPVSAEKADTSVVKEESDVPEWWNIPLPLVLYKGKKVVLNPAATALFDGAPIPSFSKKTRRPKEFLVEIHPASKKKKNKESSQMLFTELQPSVFFVQDVTDDLRNAEQMAWWASIGQAFVSNLKCKGKSVRHIRASDPPPQEENTESLACIWEENLLGYICIDDKQTD